VRVDVLTIFPDYLAPLGLSLIGKAASEGRLDLRVHDLREWTTDRHRTVDDTPYGGGAGMVMKPEPWGAALDAVTAEGPGDPVVLVPTPSGRRFTQALAHELAEAPWLVFVCGRYEGIDARVVDEAAGRWRVEEISLGDYVLNGGEVAAMVIVEAVARLLPGVGGNAESLVEESHALGSGLLEYPSSPSRPAGATRRAPVLLSGDHAAVARWRRDEALPPYGGPAAPTCSPTSTKTGSTPPTCGARRARMGSRHRRPGDAIRPARTACGRLTGRCRCAVGTSRAPATGGALHRRVARPSSTDPQRVGDCGHRRGSDLPMNTLDALDAAFAPRRHSRLPPRRHAEGSTSAWSRATSRVQVFQGVAIRRQGSGVRENVHRAQDQLWRRRRADVPAATPRSSSGSRSSPAVTCAGPSSTTCATCAARPPRSRRSARPRPLAAERVPHGRGAPAGSCPGASYDVVPSGRGRPAPARGAGRGDPRQDLCRAGLCHPVRVDAADPAGR